PTRYASYDPCRGPLRSSLFPYTTLFRSAGSRRSPLWRGGGTVFGPVPRSYAFSMPKKKRRLALCSALSLKVRENAFRIIERFDVDRKSTRLNSSHQIISYAVFCLKKKTV